MSEQQHTILPKYQVERLHGTVERTVTKYTKEGFMQETVQEPAGFMVYFPSGASMRARSEEHLRELGIDPDAEPGLVDMETGEDVPTPPRTNLKMRAAASVRRGKRSASANEIEVED